MPKPHKGESKKAYISRCMGDTEMNRKHSDSKQRAAICYSFWDNRNSSMQISVQAKADTSKTRKEKFDGKDFLVVPVVALVEGVLFPSNAASPELALAEEFGKFPESWNGRPVVMDHPKDGTTPISANSPQVLEKESFGILFNTTLEGRKLFTEAWLDLGKIEEQPEDSSIQQLLASIQAGEIIEVSTGLFMTLEPVDGVYNGREFDGIWRDIVPDHLALLSPGTLGACSIADGCGGNRVNALIANSAAILKGVLRMAEEPNPVNKSTQTPDNTMMCGSDQGSCMMMGSATCDPNMQNCSMKVGSPAMMQAGDCGCDGAVKPKPGALSALIRGLTKFGSIFRIDKQYLSDVDRREAIQAAMRSKDGASYYVVAVFDDKFVYEDYSKGGLYSRGYSISDGGKVSLKEDPVQVRQVTEFVPVTTNNAAEEKDQMAAVKAKVDALIADKRTRFTENDRKFLEGLSEEQITLVSPVEEPAQAADKASEKAAADKAAADAAAATTAAVATNASNPTGSKSALENRSAPINTLTELNKVVQPAAVSPPEPKKVPTVAEYIAAAPLELQEVLEEGIRLQTSEKNALIKGILESKGNQFPESELRALSLTLLDRLAKLASVTIVADYGGRAAGVSVARVNRQDNEAPMMPETFAKVKTFVPGAAGTSKEGKDNGAGKSSQAA